MQHSTGGLDAVSSVRAGCPSDCKFLVSCKITAKSIQDDRHSAPALASSDRGYGTVNAVTNSVLLPLPSFREIVNGPAGAEVPKDFS